MPDAPEFDGRRAGGLVHVLKGTTPFIANLHGVAAEEWSWVFTKTDLAGLLADSGYKQFVGACLATRTILFAGISADDVAVGGYLEALTRERIDFGEHFWITTNQDPTVRACSEKAGLRMIHYSMGDDGRHELGQMFEDLAQYVSVDDTPPPVPPVADQAATGVPN